MGDRVFPPDYRNVCSANSQPRNTRLCNRPISPTPKSVQNDSISSPNISNHVVLSETVGTFEIAKETDEVIANNDLQLEILKVETLHEDVEFEIKVELDSSDSADSDGDPNYEPNNSSSDLGVDNVSNSPSSDYFKVATACEKNDKKNDRQQNRSYSNINNLRDLKQNGEKKSTKKQKDFCLFCKTYVLNFARHILRHHGNEKEAKRISMLSPNNITRKKLFNELRRKGNFINSAVICKPVKRSVKASNILPCTNCLGFYSAKQLWRHRKHCMGGTNDKSHQVTAQNFLLKNLQVDKQLRDLVFPRMRPDDISMTAKMDELICDLGAQYVKTHHKKRSIIVASRKMRELAKLLIEVKKMNPSIKNLFESLRSQHFGVLVAATKSVAKYNEDEDFFGSATTAFNLSTSIKQCCRIATTSVLEGKQALSTISAAEAETDLKTLIQLIDSKWRLEMSTQASSDQIVMKRNKNRTDTIENCKNICHWEKRNTCPYCLQDVTHFSRHLLRQHSNESIVNTISTLPQNHLRRRDLINLLRRKGNFLASNQTKTVRPVRRSIKITPNAENDKEKYVTCQDCFGYFGRNYFKLHRKTCRLRQNIEETTGRQNYLTEAQMAIICGGPYSEFYKTLRLKDEVFNIMRPDERSKVAMNDILICCYGENHLKKHEGSHIKTTVSNKMRELARLLIALREIIGAQTMFEVLKPEYFDNLVSATRIISGYNAENKSYKAGSLALHMGTTLKQVCHVATKLITNKYRFLVSDDAEDKVNQIECLKQLIEHRWNSEIGNVALKDTNEKKWDSPRCLPLTDDITIFCQHVMSKAKEAVESLKSKMCIEESYRLLSECVLSLIVLLNPKRLREIQYLKVETYTTNNISIEQQEWLETLSEAERLFTESFKIVVIEDEAGKPVAILFPKETQDLIDVMLQFREDCITGSNEYLFAKSETENRSLNGYDVVRDFAIDAGVGNKNLFNSTELRINISQNELEQIANFMGHTKKTHEEYCRLSQDVYQTAKVSKLLLALEKGKLSECQGKTQDEIHLSEPDKSDSCEENEEQSEAEKNSLNPSKKRREENSLTESLKGKENKGRPKIIHIKWTNEQKELLTEHFKDHILKKIPPKKYEVEALKQKHHQLLANKDWIKIKAYVYNLYRDK